ncbi:ATP-binding protein [Fusibacter tunisiensis]|uniref:SpoVK/Ycf46/Vps4 family AAA+-type ATPase n=1 Tax=Fusibacter tunisiensis TaxID=1008308 RepID=A0ABS2MT92_9FIRM|nr:ATP-binding protein [Fusibacter tunisiensis]MBM7562619.1 SpoVK/Ycf46/Vps4 family AAA+-type ATPase [Fusibacter tunisiensis]
MLNWMNDIFNRYKSGVSNFFIVQGNIYDYAEKSVPVITKINKLLYEMNFQEIATFDQQDGLFFREGTYGTKQPNQTDFEYIVRSISNPDKKAAFIMLFPEFTFPSNTNNDPYGYGKLISMMKCLTSANFQKSNNMLILLVDNAFKIDERIRTTGPSTTMITIPHPNTKERLEMIEFLNETSQKKINSELNDQQFANLTAGLSRIQIEDIYLNAESCGQLDKKDIIKKKQEFLSKEYGDVLELLESDGLTFDDFAGQEHVKEYCKEMIVNPMTNGELDLVPKGVLLMGPPGTGKSYFAKCLAGEASATAVLLKMEKIKSKWVGESESKLAKVFMGLQALSPVIVFLDELDQSFHRSSSDTQSVDRNQFGMMLQFLSEPENRGKIVWLGAANYPNKVDEALKRPGRFDKKIPFLPPSKEEIVEIFKIHLKSSKFKIDVSEDEMQSLAVMLEGYTPAEIEAIVLKAKELLKRKKLTKIDFKLLQLAGEYTLSVKNERIDEMVKIAIEECSDREFLCTYNLSQ